MIAVATVDRVKFEDSRSSALQGRVFCRLRLLSLNPHIRPVQFA